MVVICDPCNRELIQGENTWRDPGGVKEGFLLEIMRTQKDIKETGKGHFTQRDWYGRKPRGGENIF